MNATTSTLYIAIVLPLAPRNLQGDIVAVYNQSGAKIGTYTYDAWGNHAVTAASGISTQESQVLNTLNPFRYRSYFYDVETGLYYLQSRYYNPEWGRFISADGYINANGDLIGFNMFAYCGNNPIIYKDKSGEAIVSILFAIGLGVGLIAGSILIPNQDELNDLANAHYSRNELNDANTSIDDVLETYEKQSEFADKYHEYTSGPQGQDGIYNDKYLSPNGGHIEIIISSPPNKTPYIVDESIDPTNMGTYNYASNQQWSLFYGVEHFFKDMVPYYFFGNTREDSGGLFKWAIN